MRLQLPWRYFEAPEAIDACSSGEIVCSSVCRFCYSGGGLLAATVETICSSGGAGWQQHWLAAEET
jgi:hypothetical protein